MAEQTILIAEDDPDIRDGVRILLSGEGYHIIEAENGTRALEVFRPEVDLVIKYNNLSWKLRSVSSSNDPVISFRYLAMNGIVLPSSISLIVVSTCPRLIPSSSCKILIISISSPYKSTSIVCPFGTNWRYLTPAISNIFFDAFVVSLPAYLSCI